MAIDPICGMTVDESIGLSADRNGQTWYFCCDHCRQRFLQPGDGEPLQQDLAMLSAPSCCGTGADVEPPATGYYCPMCEGVTSPQPGWCPKCGMALELAGLPTSEPDDAELLDLTRRFRVSLVFGVPVFAIAMLPMTGVSIEQWLTPAANRWLQALLATPVVWWCGWPFLQRGWQSFLTRRLNMFTLISIGVGAAYSYSLVATIFPTGIPEAFRNSGHVDVYFEAASIITMLVLAGQVLELRGRQRTGAAIRELLELVPKTAHQLTTTGTEDIPVELVRRGDILRVLPGEQIPVDGVVSEGESHVDESMISGEPIPVRKSAGSTVTGGTLNGTGSFLMTADRVGSETTLSEIVAMVSAAQRSRAPIQRLADIVAGWFVPVVVSVSVLTFLVWAVMRPAEPALAYALVNAIAVLIVACPCALGLANPMSITVGIGRGAREGVLIRNAEVLEQLDKVRTVLIDKTGTLTQGQPSVTEVVSVSDFEDQQLIQLAASVEQYSEHPLAAAIVSEAHSRAIEVLPASGFESVTGNGVLASVGEYLVAVGSQDFMSRHAGSAVPESLSDRVNDLRLAGRSTVFVAVDGICAGLLAISDPIKESTPEALRALKQLGLKIVMLTGDNRETACAISSGLAIDHVEFELSPGDKLDRINHWKSDGQLVAMAGDGINDAPALAAADVGIAMGSGTDVAIESAGVTLVGGDLRGLVKSIQLSRLTMRNIRQNLFFAFFYNLLGIPIAAGALYPISADLLLNPMVAAAAMSCSSLSIITNALRLRTLKLDRDTRSVAS